MHYNEHKDKWRCLKCQAVILIF
ncbi:hypothetical protein GA516_14035 [Lactobacillus pentosus]|uniref:Transposase n=1 Tax=Lactiplantibacillus pentosus TaxID=1589 RepID=A0AB37RDF4_LACPE|nr:hypothetical protein [Lactiplantibacillus pentosus]RMW42109.1 hypothetical protein D6U19_15695 [Lactiplantibacillus pentosus]RMW45490.1 hypothetical protein D6U20_07605 [Lactiplantibacillus pentosus]RMW51714.1 hypothetical protein D6U21_15675 [Lactiplantibacillus pentosus]RMW52042.1 hypothetical protein D6U17_15015 [Lactiplantibacillus pentosus]